jgi:ketosteroid isomerase-like protein
MSQENVEIVRLVLDAFAAADAERLVVFAAPEIELEAHQSMVEGNYHGHAGIEEFMADAFETVEVRGIDHRDMRDLGDRVLALGTFRIYGRASGIETEIPFAIVAKLQGGLLIHLKDYGTRVPALKAVGLEE